MNTKSSSILYLYLGGTEKKTSVQKKVVHQINGLNNAGFNCVGKFYAEKNSNTKLNDYVDLIRLTPFTKSPFLFRDINRGNQYWKEIQENLSVEIEKYDLVFIRLGLVSPSFFKFIDKYKSKVVLFIPSNGIDEAFWIKKVTKSSGPAGFALGWIEHFVSNYWQLKKLYKTYLPRIKATVAYTPQFAQILYSESGNKAKTIYNRDGVDTQSVTERDYNRNNAKDYRLIVLKGGATVQPWSGLDRLIKSVEASKRDDIQLILAGSNYPTEYKNYSFIKLTGMLGGDELEEAINSVDIGVSYLATHLIKFTETTNMKSRDYFARGLPFMHSNKMPDITDSNICKYVLQVPPNDELIDIDAVVNFIDKIRQDKNHTRTMRAFAEKNLDWKVTTKELADSLKELI